MSQGAFTPVWFKDDNVINAGQTKVVHQISVAQFRSVNYILTFFNESQQKTKTAQLAVIKDSGLRFNLFGKLGKLNIAIDPAEVSGNLDLSITNNESFSISLELAFATLGET